MPRAPCRAGQRGHLHQVSSGGGGGGVQVLKFRATFALLTFGKCQNSVSTPDVRSSASELLGEESFDNFGQFSNLANIGYNYGHFSFN